MNWAKPLIRSALLSTLLGAGGQAIAGQNVTALAGNSIDTYARQSDYFVKTQTLPSSALLLPMQVLEENPRGYVKVSLQGKEVWLDLMDVMLHPPKSAGETGCVPVRYEGVAGVSRGAGEGCK